MNDTTCGWLMEQVEMKYARLIKESKQNKQKMTQKIIVTLKTIDQNENIDYWLTQYSRSLKALPNQLEVQAHYSKIILNKPKKVCINDFESLKVIGKGGFSKVYMVRKKDTGFLFAMKVMKKNYVTNDSKLKQIMNERTIMEALVDHPFIIKLHYAFQSKENLHFIIDLCTGGEMFYHLQQRHHYPEYMAKFYFAEILLGLDFLHSKNIVYRDLKPENVLIDIDGHIKLADFGLSKIFKQDERSFSFCGSPEYMCPEILKREGHNHMVDYYTLGAILFEMLTGLPPYYATNKSEMTKRILESELTYPSHLNTDVIDLMKGLLERNPNKRIGSTKGVEEIKEQEWCKDIDWMSILSKKMTPPWKPRLDQSNFDPEYTSLPLNFDESNFKRSLQGDREFSFYYESPCQSLTVTEHSIYCSASNSDLVSQQQLQSQPSQAYMEMELLLKCGSSKKLIEHFKQHTSEQNPTSNHIDSQKLHELLIAQLQYQGDRSSMMFSQSKIDKIEEVIIQEHLMSELNMETALRINQNLIRDESKINLEYNEESGQTNFRGFSFYGESYDENQVKKQLIKYTKLRNKLNKKLKVIQDEQGVIRRQDIINLSLSSPDSSLNSSFITNTVLPTPPVLEDAASSRNSNRPSTQMQSSSQVDQQSQRSSPQPFVKQISKVSSDNTSTSQWERGVINKKMKQQMICAKLEEQKTPNKIEKKPLYKSFQPINNNPFNQQQHTDYLDESIQNVSSNDESVAEERKQFQDNISSNIAIGRLSIGSGTLNNAQKDKKKVDFQDDIKDLNRSALEDNENPPSEESSQDVNTLKGVKFHLFQSSHISKNNNKVDKSIRQQLKQNKIVVTQRNRNTKTSLAIQDPIYSRKSNPNQSNNTSNNTTSNSRIQQMIHNAQHQSNGNSSLANSRDQYEYQQTTLTNQTSNNEQLSEQKSASEKTNAGLEYVSTKHTQGDHQSIKSSIMKKTFENYDQQSQSFQEYQNREHHIETQLNVDVALTIDKSFIKINKQKTHVENVRKIQIPAFKKNLEIDIPTSPDRQKETLQQHLKTNSLQLINEEEVTNMGLRQGLIQSQMASPKGDLETVFSKHKLSVHSKQVSLDYNAFTNELFNIKLEGKTEQNINNNQKQVNLKSNTLKVNKNSNTKSIFQSTPTSQGSIKRLGQFGPSPKNQIQKHIPIIDDTFDNNQQNSDEDIVDNNNNQQSSKRNTQNSKKISTNNSKKELPLKVQMTKLTTLKAQSALKKGTPATNSTIGFIKMDQVIANPLPSTKASNQKNFIMKPPVNKISEGVPSGNMSSQLQSQGNKKLAFQNQLGKQGGGNQSANNGSSTPSGNKGTSQNNSIGNKVINNQQAYSQPTSAKNSQSQKFAFIPTTQSHLQEGGFLSPKRQDKVKLPKQPLKYQQSLVIKTQISSLQNSTIKGSENDDKKVSNIEMNLDQLLQESILHSQAKNISIGGMSQMKQPKTSTNKSSQNKGFFS